jgi:hypothetical protein
MPRPVRSCARAWPRRRSSSSPCCPHSRLTALTWDRWARRFWRMSGDGRRRTRPWPSTTAALPHAAGTDPRPGLHRQRKPHRAVHRLHRGWLPLPRRPAPTTWALLPVQPQGRRQDRYRTAHRRTGPALPGTDRQPTPPRRDHRRHGEAVRPSPRHARTAPDHAPPTPRRLGLITGPHKWGGISAPRSAERQH